ncbi:CsbD-like protein [Stackebrandtia endophytica]|uniref:CsbD-like protein n=1 Tax=Stackebrandtia endophytica TaxID=1496996 RepID=A0A543B3Z4_9ACTN|nr:CsbD family protein [Stackebrandtia endophytica]TQL79513.1 CsbD-like protein [Stackebrandtia endophytica]
MADKTEKLVGKAKEMAGKLTGDDKLESEGSSQKAKGSVQEKMGQAREKVEGAVKGLKGDKDAKSD